MDDTSDRRSAGQRQVHVLASQLVPAYHRTDWDQLEPLAAELRTMLAANPIVGTDPITAAPLGYGPYAASYIDWLLANSDRSERERFPPDIRLDRFVYRRADFDQRQAPPRYLGGVKWASTMHAILSIAAGQPMLRYDLEARYFAHSGILTIANGGNHRLLAYVLIGEPCIEADRFEWCEEAGGPDPMLNAALRTIEDLYPVEGHFQLDILDARQMEAETHAARTFTDQTSSEERSVIAAYLHAVEQRVAESDPQRDMRSIAGLLDCVEQLRLLRDHGDIAWIRGLRSRLPSTQQQNLFARWYARYITGDGDTSTA